MKQKLLTQAMLVIALTITATLQSQVTIGSNEKPLSGTILDLKEQAGVGANARKGLAMPRVILTQKDKLFPMFESISGTNYIQAGKDYDKATQDANHVGLIVYHPDKCTLNGKGLYVWTGKEWDKLGEDTFAALSLGQASFDLPSGKDARDYLPQNLLIKWGGTLAPTWQTAGNNELSEIPFTDNPLSPTALISSPVSMEFLPDVMIIDENSPWQSKETKLTFTDNECTDTHDVILNQTNYALKVNNQFTDSQIIYTTTASGKIKVQGNATWTTVVTGYPNTATISPTAGGITLKNGNTHTVDVQYTPGDTRYEVIDIAFKDSEPTKRFKDITVSITNCNETQNDPSLEEWAIRAGFTQEQINSIPDTGGTFVDGNGVPVTTSNGIQLHKDQNGNIFLSGKFGATAGRWMLNNLAATTYDPQRSIGSEAKINMPMPPNPYVAMNQEDKPLWCYPKTATINATFNNNKRLGVLYNWAAASNGKGRFDRDGNELNTTGKALINDGEDQNTNPAKIQGICPNGWHLPSDWEWTQLEQEINSNTSLYSSLPDANENIIQGATGMRGTTHVRGMEDPCPAPQSPFRPVGKSNLISGTEAVTPGFNAMHAGLADNNSFNYGADAHFWSANCSSDYAAWKRAVSYFDEGIGRRQAQRYYSYSVRCKKDD